MFPTFPLSPSHSCCPMFSTFPLSSSHAFSSSALALSSELRADMLRRLAPATERTVLASMVWKREAAL